MKRTQYITEYSMYNNIRMGNIYEVEKSFAELINYDICSGTISTLRDKKNYAITILERTTSIARSKGIDVSIRNNLLQEIEKAISAFEVLEILHFLIIYFSLKIKALN